MQSPLAGNHKEKMGAPEEAPPSIAATTARLLMVLESVRTHPLMALTIDPRNDPVTACGADPFSL